ncbi:MAG: hypothetical protein M3011_06175 [Actinomycetota bacterium]|nr:hypothetical protein [Actinomycetota bacterium]
MGTSRQWCESDEVVSDDELCEAALAADPESTVPDDARCLWDLTTPDDDDHLLPQWYMPPPMAGPSASRRWWRWVAVVIIVAFLAIDAYGLCSTYGEIVLA